MKYFTRVKLLSNLLLCISVPFVICTTIWAFKIDKLNVDINWFIFMALLLISFVSLLLGFALKLIAKEANEEVASIYRYYDTIIKEIKESSEK